MSLCISRLSQLRHFLAARPQTSRLYMRPISIERGHLGAQLIEAGCALPLAGQQDCFSFAELIWREAEAAPNRVIAPAALIREMAQEDSAVAKRLDRLTSPRVLPQKLGRKAAKIMGIVNVTPDSFSDGGRYNAPLQAIAHGERLIEEGADILDIGGESTRPGAKEVSPDEEIDRILPVIEGLRDSCLETKTLISIDTRHASTMRVALKAGADIINDVTALQNDPDSMQVAANSGKPVCLMHMQGAPRTMQKNPTYQDAVLDIFDFLEDRIEACRSHHIPSGRLLADVGIGFGKSVQHNCQLLGQLPFFQGLGVSLLMGVSRKSFIHQITKAPDPLDRVPGSLLAGLQSLQDGAWMLRVHDVKETIQALKVLRAIQSES